VIDSNQNHNHEMKEIFKGAATRASCGVGPFDAEQLKPQAA